MSSFAFYGTFEFAEEFAQLPVDTFLRFVNEEIEKRQTPTTQGGLGIGGTHRQMANPEKRVIVIGCHPRCGGTLLTQLFEDDPMLTRPGQGMILSFSWLDQISSLG